MRRPARRWLTLAAVLLAGAPRAQEAPPPRLLMIALDAVPYGVVARVADPTLGDNAAFHGFAGPAPVISTFPSTTSLALAGMLASFGLDESPGYEHRFYDRGRNRKRGGVTAPPRGLYFVRADYPKELGLPQRDFEAPPLEL